MLGAEILSWENVWSIFIVLGLVINTYAMSFKDPQHIRISVLITCPMVLLYDCIVVSLGGIIFESVSIISAIIGAVRYKNIKQNVLTN